MQKVIGLDIGSYSIKAIEIVNTFKSYEIANFYETVVPNLEGVPLDAVAACCMEQLFRENNLEADRIIAAMPGQFVSSRILPFNFSDSRKIESSIMVQLEDLVPFNMDDMVVNHQVLGQYASKTQVLAVMTRKVFLRNFLDQLARLHIDPKLVDIDSLAFYNLASFLPIEPQTCYGIIDIGHEKTSICVVKDGLLRMFRSINLGGRYITEFLARDLEVSFHEAQRTKHRVSQVRSRAAGVGNLSGQDAEIAERMTLAANAIVKELGRTFYSYKSWEHEPLSHIFISGGTAKIRNLAEFLAEQLEVPVSKFTLDGANLKVNDDVSDKFEVVAQSLAIGMRAVSNIKKHSQINLRRGEFAYTQNYESLLKGVATGARVIGLVLALLIVSYVFKYYFYSSQIDDVQAQYRREYSIAFPDLAKKSRSANTTFMKYKKDAEGRLKRNIADKRNGIFEYQMSNSGSGALRALKAISEKIPKDTVIDVTHFEFKALTPGTGKLILKAETDNFTSQSTIIDALKSIPILKDVEEKGSGTKPGSDGKKIEFTVHANYEAQNLSGES
ncbi:MAG: pilus assembly protein PilM [Oligoflexales bacterium]